MVWVEHDDGTLKRRTDLEFGQGEQMRTSVRETTAKDVRVYQRTRQLPDGTWVVRYAHSEPLPKA